MAAIVDGDDAETFRRQMPHPAGFHPVHPPVGGKAVDEQHRLARARLVKGDLHAVRIEFLHGRQNMLIRRDHKRTVDSMAAGAIPHFHNSMGLASIEVGSHTFMCMGALPPFDHPHVFLTMGAGHDVICPYCSTHLQAQCRTCCGQFQTRCRALSFRGGISPSPTIREYRDSDEAAVLALIRELQAFEMPMNPYLRPPAGIGTPYLDETRNWCAKSGGVMLVSEGPQGLSGYACVLTACEEEGKDSEVPYLYGLVADLVVTSNLRGQGIGTALLRECERLCRDKGRSVFRIGVMAQNHAARAAYAKFGFADRHYTLEKILT